MPCQFIHALHIRFTFLNCVKESDLKNADDLSICSRLIFPFFFLFFVIIVKLVWGKGRGVYYAMMKQKKEKWVEWGRVGCSVVLVVSYIWSCLQILYNSFTIVMNMISLAALTKNLSMKDDDETEMIIALTSDRGLCGSIHSSVVKAIKARLATKDDAKLVLVGDKAKAMLQK